MFLDNKIHQDKLTELFDTYNNTLKPLIAEVEICYEEFPSPVFNEIRAYNDHIARCFLSDTEVSEELNRSEGHLKRIILDCFKYLNVYSHDKFRNFNKKYKNVNLTIISDGQFIKSYTELFNNFKSSVRDAKRSEGRDSQKCFECYEMAYNYSKELSELIDLNHWKLWRAKALFFGSKIGKIIFWVLSIVLTSIITHFFGVILSFLDGFVKS